MAGTNRDFSAMLNQYLPNDLLKNEFEDRDWFLKNVEKDEGWKGGDLIVPFQGAPASTVTFGSLAPSSDVAKYNYVRGSIQNQPEVWGTLVFNHRDLLEHDGKVNEKSFLKILPGQVDDFLSYMKMCVSLAITNGPVIDTLRLDGAAGGLLSVNRVERFVIGMKIRIDDNNSAAVTGYVRKVNVNDDEIVVYDARTGGAPVVVTAYTVAEAAKIYFDGTDPDSANFATNRLSAVKDMLLPASAGGSSTLYGQTKVDYPYLQSIAASGVSITAVNIIEVIFNHLTLVRRKGKGNPTKVVMSFKNLGSVMSVLEAQKGAYHIDQKSMKVSNYGWTEIEVFSVKGGAFTIVGIVEMDDDWMAFLDMAAFVFYSNGMFRKRMSPDGNEYFEVRETTGYSYLVDVCLFGDLVLIRPSVCGILHSISY